MQRHRPSNAYLIDLDGTLIRGGAPLPFAAPLLDSLNERFVVLSNDAEHMPEQLSRSLRAMNLHVPPERIVLAGATAVDLVAREMPGARVMLLASTVLRTYARRLGIELVESGGDVVLLGRDRQFNFTRLAAAANAVRDGAELIIANPDRTHPGKDGAVVPETGALLNAILACTGEVAYRIIGKPETPMFWKALALLGAQATDTVMIGDNVETDGRGALRAGIAFVHIDDWVAQPGSSKPTTEQVLAGG
ncbi:HAD hydrolase-like protein [Bradyrhizobium sp. LHD-71]|uniref:HAD-IIA family hydrolase n=1 Tax=Bradyrhizobium sp. LHD-71 TaxID=3072141 RepID=UPI00280FF54C|nr:HAD hydrolase-like protein [Bradyrhizobium sp. LHD-71]MDQ8732115.1 HAD hydrolase-like protein [Bradyrhizobium sp. LHD-71]